MQVPFNLTTKFNSDLQELAQEREQFVLAKAFILDQISAMESIKTSELRDRYSLLSYVCRILNENKDAVEFASKALKLSKNLNMILLIVVDQMRLASAHQGLKDYKNADAILKEAIQLCESYQPLDEVIDFVYHQLAKSLFEQGNFEESKLYFEKALNVREGKGVEELTVSTQFALEIVKKRMNKH